MSQIEQFKLFAEGVNNIWKEKLRQEISIGDIPDEFTGKKKLFKLCSFAFFDFDLFFQIR